MGNSAPSSGIIGVIFLGVAVVLVLIVHTSISIISRRRFARRFERLVQNGRVIPVLSSEEGPNASKLRKVTKVREVWVRASVSILDWMPLSLSRIRVVKSPSAVECILARRKNNKRQIEGYFPPSAVIKDGDLVIKNDLERGVRAANQFEMEKLQVITMISMPSINRRRFSATRTTWPVANPPKLSTEGKPFFEGGYSEIGEIIHSTLELGITELEVNSNLSLIIEESGIRPASPESFVSKEDRERRLDGTGYLPAMYAGSRFGVIRLNDPSGGLPPLRFRTR